MKNIITFKSTWKKTLLVKKW